MQRLTVVIAAVGLLLLSSTSAEARNNRISGQHELSGGIGFAADLGDWTPGGFKWFNDYGYQLTRLTWLNFQLNVTTAGGGRDCFRRGNGDIVCDGRRHFGGTALELAGGVKLKWRLTRRAPLQIRSALC